MNSGEPSAPTRRHGLRLAAFALLAYALLAAFQLRAVLDGDLVLSPASFVVRGGPFDESWRELTPPGVDLLGDSARQFTPWLIYAARHLRDDGELPLWKATAFCGAPLVGNGQSALFFPTRLIALLLGAPPWVHAAMAWLRLVVASFGAFLLLRHLRVGALGAWVGGFAFGFGGFLIVFRFHPQADVAALLPWLVLAGDRLALRPGARRVGVFALLAGLQWLAGHPQTAVQCQLAVALLVLVRAWSARRTAGGPGLAAPLAAFAAGLLLGLLVAAIQLVPLAEYAALSEGLLQRTAMRAALVRPSWWTASFLLGLALTAIAIVRLFRGRRAAGPGALLFLGVALALASGLHCGLSEAFMLPLCADWFGTATAYMGPLNYVEGNGAWIGAALVLAAAGLFFGRDRGVVRVAALAAALGVLAGLRAPVLMDVVRALPVVGLADNGRLVLLGLLGLAVLAGFGVDALLSVPAGVGARARLAAAVLAPALAAFVVLALGVRDGAIVSRDLPGGTRAPLALAHFGLLHDSCVDAVLALEQHEPSHALQPELPEDDEHLQVIGFAALREPLRSAQVLYSSHGVVAAARWSRVRDLTAFAGLFPDAAGTALPPGWSIYVFRAAVDCNEVPPERVPLRVRAVTRSSSVLESDVLWSNEPTRATPLPFPAQPAPEPADGTRELLVLAAALLLAVAACGASGRLPRIATALLAVAVVIDLLPFGEALAPVVPRDFFYPRSGALLAARDILPDQRVVAMDSHALAAEILTAFDLPEVRGYDALTPPHVACLVRGALDWPDRESSMEMMPARSDPDLRLLGLMSVGELIAWPQAPPGLPRLSWEGQERAASNVRVPIVVNPQVLPRARLVTRAVVQPDDAAALALLRDPDFDPATACVLAAADGAPPALLAQPETPRPAAAAPPAGRARIAVDLPDRVRVEIAPSAPALLLLADTDFPGWRATVDGVERPILRANVAFRAVPVGPGDGAVEFRYAPRSFEIGRLVTLLALAAAGALLLFRPR